MLFVRELRAYASRLNARDFRQQLGPFVLVQKPPDEEIVARASQKVVARTVVRPKMPVSLLPTMLFELDELIVASLPPMQDADTLLVGRQPDCELVIDDPSVSRHHARIKWIAAARRASVEDLESSNGTRVNGQEVDGRVWLRDGDNLHFGDARFCYMLSESLFANLTHR